MTDGAARLPPAYWRLWTASTISNLGDGVFIVALPLFAARLTRSELSIAFIGVVGALPWLVLSLPIGAVVDRVDHRRLMVRADVFRAAVIGAVTIAVAAGEAQVWMLWLAAACLGVAEVFFDNASQAILPSIVSSDLLEKANGRRIAAELAANGFVGRAIGGALLVAAVWLPFGVNAASFVIAAILVLTIATSTSVPRQPASRRLRADIAEGLRWLSEHHVLRALAVAAGLALLGMEMTTAIFVLFAQDLLNLSERWFGALVAIGAAGAVIGGLAAERLFKRFGAVAIVYSTVVVWIVCMFAEGFWPRVWVSAVVNATMAFGTTVWNTVTVSLRQRLVPAHLFGRVNSVYRWLVWGSISIGAALGGLVARWFGLRAPFFVGAGLAGIALLTLLTSKSRHSLASLAAQYGAPTPRGTADDTPVVIEADPW